MSEEHPTDALRPLGTDHTAPTKVKHRKFVMPDLAEVEAYAMRGATMTQIAAALGINRMTLHNQRKLYKALDDAIRRGQAKGCIKVANKLYEKAINGDITAEIFYLKCKGGWQETTTVQVQGDINLKQQVVFVAPAQLNSDEFQKMLQDQRVKLVTMGQIEKNDDADDVEVIDAAE